MMKKIRIFDKKDNILNFDLRDILPECSEWANRKWLAWQVDCFGSEWFSKFSTARYGQLEMTYGELCDYAKNVSQTIDGAFLALKPNIEQVPVLSTGNSFDDFSDLVIQACDSTFFEVSTTNQALIDALQKKFNKIEIVD